MKRFIIILLIGLLLLGLGIAVRSKYGPILNREVVHYCEQCYNGEDDVEHVILNEGSAVCKYREVVHYSDQCNNGKDDAGHVILDNGLIVCECGEYLGDEDREDVYTNVHLIEKDWERHGDLYRGCVYSIIFGAILLLLGTLDALRDWSERNGY